MIGAVSAASLVIYLPVIHRGSAYVPMNQPPFFNFSAPLVQVQPCPTGPEQRLIRKIRRPGNLALDFVAFGRLNCGR